MLKVHSFDFFALPFAVPLCSSQLNNRPRPSETGQGRFSKPRLILVSWWSHTVCPRGWSPYSRPARWTVQETCKYLINVKSKIQFFTHYILQSPGWQKLFMSVLCQRLGTINLALLLLFCYTKCKFIVFQEWVFADSTFLSLQEIDGKALMLLRSDVIMKYMGLKLGPALKLCHHIERLKQTKQ